MLKFYHINVVLLLLLKILLSNLNNSSPEKGIKFQQNDYVISFERVEVIRYNKTLLRHFSIVTFKYNRTTPAINVTMYPLIKLGLDLQIITQAYKFASNEYRLFPIRLAINFCESIKKNVFGTGNFIKCGNFTGCPISKKPFHFCNWTIDYSKAPPFIPNGKYMLEFQGMLSSLEVYVLHAYGSVTRPISWT